MEGNTDVLTNLFSGKVIQKPEDNSALSSFSGKSTLTTETPDKDNLPDIDAYKKPRTSSSTVDLTGDVTDYFKSRQFCTEEYKWPPLPVHTLKKIEGFGVDGSMPLQAILPAEHNRWFYWWVTSHPEKKPNFWTVRECLHQGKIDGVIPGDIWKNKRIPHLENFTLQKLKNVKATMMKKIFNKK